MTRLRRLHFQFYLRVLPACWRLVFIAAAVAVWAGNFVHADIPPIPGQNKGRSNSEVKPGPAAFADEEFSKRYDAARQSFEKGDYTRTQYLAESLLKDSLEKGFVSPQLFQLLGHTRYRQGDLGRAALWYNRARMFPPPVPEIVQNLSHIKNRTGHLVFRSGSFGDQYTSLLSRTQWMRLLVVCGWTVIFSLFLFFFIVRWTWLRTLLMAAAVVALITGTMAYAGWHLHPTYDQVKDLAVVTAPNTESYTAATTTAGKAGKVISLPVGSQVRRLEDRGLWSYIEVWREDREANGGGEFYRGWVQNDALAAFWPFDAKFLE